MKISKYSLLLLFVSLIQFTTVEASPMDKLIGTRYPFQDLFNENLYDLENFHLEYNFAQFEPGDTQAKTDHLLARKKKRVEDTIILELLAYKAGM